MEKSKRLCPEQVGTEETRALPFDDRAGRGQPATTADGSSLRLWIAEYTTHEYDSGFVAVAARDQEEAEAQILYAVPDTYDHLGDAMLVTDVDYGSRWFKVVLEEVREGEEERL